MDSFLRNMKNAQEPMDVSTKQERIAKPAKQSSKMSVTSLNHFLDEEWFMEVFKRLKKDKAVGGTINPCPTSENRHQNVFDLMDRARSGRDFRSTCQTVYIPRPTSSEKRPIVVLTFDEKIKVSGLGGVYPFIRRAL